MQLNNNTNNTIKNNIPSTKNSEYKIFAHDTWTLTRILSMMISSITSKKRSISNSIPSSNNNFNFCILRSRNNYHLTNEKKSCEQQILIKKSLSFHHQYLKNIINQKYFFSSSFYKYSRFLLKNTFNFIKKRF